MKRKMPAVVPGRNKKKVVRARCALRSGSERLASFLRFLTDWNWKRAFVTSKHL
jgi:hypothetical protein